VRAGVLSRDQLRSAAWRRLRPDVYVDASLPVDHLLQARGVSRVAPPEAAFGGLTAVALWGGREFVTPDGAVEDRLRAAGWRVVFVTAAEMHHPEALIREIWRALAR
jgi:hypothetical protein